MAQKIRIKINSPGIVQVLKSSGVSADLTRRGEAIARAAGPGFEAETTENRDRAVVFVTADTTEARIAEAEDRALTRAVNAGR